MSKIACAEHKIACAEHKIACAEHFRHALACFVLLRRSSSIERSWTTSSSSIEQELLLLHNNALRKGCMRETTQIMSPYKKSKHLCVLCVIYFVYANETNAKKSSTSTSIYS